MTLKGKLITVLALMNYLISCNNSTSSSERSIDSATSVTIDSIKKKTDSSDVIRERTNKK